MRWSLHSTDLVTFKCEGCGVRLPAERRYQHRDVSPSAWTVCTPECFRVAYALDQERRTRLQHQRRAMLQAYKESLLRLGLLTQVITLAGILCTGCTGVASLAADLNARDVKSCIWGMGSYPPFFGVTLFTATGSATLEDCRSLR